MAVVDVRCCPVSGGRPPTSVPIVGPLTTAGYRWLTDVQHNQQQALNRTPTEPWVYVACTHTLVIQGLQDVIAVPENGRAYVRDNPASTAGRDRRCGAWTRLRATRRRVGVTRRVLPHRFLSSTASEEFGCGRFRSPLAPIWADTAHIAPTHGARPTSRGTGVTVGADPTTGSSGCHAERTCHADCHLARYNDDTSTGRVTIRRAGLRDVQR